MAAVMLDALRALYDSTDGPNWDLSSGRAEWNFTAGANPCAERWQGVTCLGCSNGGQCFVSKLQLPSFNLVGTLPAALGNLTGLSELVLNSNSLSGSLPPELGNMASLQVLDLSSNALTGSLPPEL
ncbi:hypothetical protein B484DRAFT_400603, partial [Ochromonadaceae sp. CCMP2298]